ncbi:MAG: hypothetical protein M3328_00150 [Chloroflexota bacterium]|nr:hypothetical protein [Chloroflexota bacterium]
MSVLTYPRIIFPDEFDERAEIEMPMKGWLRARVEIEKGRSYGVFFMDPVRLQQELTDLVGCGEPCFAEAGLIIVPDVTVAAIEKAVLFLWERGFFSQLKLDEVPEAS